MARARNFCFTINNYTSADLENLEKIESSYILYGLEVGESGTPHVQGYVEFDNATTIRALSKKIPRAHLEIAKGNWVDNRAYIEKEDKNPTQRGTPKQQGKRNDIEAIKSRVKSGTLLMRDVVLETQNIQVIRHAQMVLTYHEVQRDWEPHVSWYYGKSGSGKTQQAKKDLGTNYYHCMRNLKWWEGYDGHENVLIDDMRAKRMEFADLLELLGSNSYRIEYKGGSRQFLARKIIITAPYSPEKMYSSTGEDMYQLTRRINVIKCFGEIEETEIDEFNEL